MISYQLIICGLKLQLQIIIQSMGNGHQRMLTSKWDGQECYYIQTRVLLFTTVYINFRPARVRAARPESEQV